MKSISNSMMTIIISLYFSIYKYQPNKLFRIAYSNKDVAVSATLSLAQ